MIPDGLQQARPPIAILMIGDLSADGITYTQYLQSDPNHHYQIVNRVKLQDGMALLRSQSFDVVLLNADLPDDFGLEQLKFLQQDWANGNLHPKVPIIILSSQADTRWVVRAMKLGAADYLLKQDITAASLRQSVLAAIDDQSLIQQLEIGVTRCGEAWRDPISDDWRLLSDRLTLALESAEIGTWEWDLVHDVDWDERMYTLYGLEHLYPLTYQNWVNVLHPDDRGRVEHLLEQSLLFGKFDTEFRVVLSNGTIRYIKAMGLMQYDQVGQAQRMVGINYDITEAKQAELALAQSAQEIEDLYNNAPCGYHSLDLEGRYIRVNETELQWLGYSREEMIGRPIIAFLTEESRQSFFKNYEIFHRQGWVKNLEYEMICKDGSILPVLISATAVTDQNGKALYNRATLLDIRDRKAIESALQESETKFRRMAENVPGMIYRYVLHPDGTDQFSYVSPHVWDIYELEPETVMQDASYLWARVYPDDIPVMQVAINASVEKLEPFLLEHRLITPKGGLRWVDVTSRPERQANGDVVWDGVVQDITDRKMAEARLQQSNVELAQATRLKDEFLANMSHELRTPLNAILGLSEALQDLVLGTLNERQLKAIGTIEKSGRHLLELINDILDLSKISSGKMDLHFEPVSIENLCSSSLVFIRQQAFQKDIQIISEIPPNLVGLVADERRIRQVLINLLTNAVKFTPPSGQVSLKVAIGFGNAWQGTATIPDQIRNQEVPLVLFQVTDTGIGIAPEDLPRLFQPFIQIDSSLNRQQLGTGLGLAMVKQITELHGGQVIVESTLGQGCCFTVALPHQMPIASVLPVNPSLERGASASATKSSESAIAPLILLVEDNEANIETLLSYLKARHYRVMVARGGEESIALARAERPDLILMDIQMPEMDGLEAIRLIRADNQLGSIPIIALTALAMPDDRERCIAAGANHYLTKPVGLRQLVEIIQQFLSS